VEYDAGIPRYEGHSDWWEDHQTGGGGARIVWCQGIAWVSAHSGYSWADITDTVREFFADLGCSPIPEHIPDPRTYGYERFKKGLEYYEGKDGD
jgi:hypothetical protein